MCTADDFRHEVISAKFSRLSEAKLTPHLAQKKYWEDKASDARDENDDMCVVNDSILRSRVPIVVMWNKNVDLSPKRKQILRLVLLYVFSCICTDICADVRAYVHACVHVCTCLLIIYCQYLLHLNANYTLSD